MHKSEHKYEIGQLVLFKSEDKNKRPHLITDVTWIDPFHEGEDGFYLYSLDEGSAAGREEILVPYIDEFTLKRVCDFLEKNNQWATIDQNEWLINAMCKAVRG